ncbi:IS3 family transposase [Liquorilactobacillus hordei]|uniref:IS3 family transposase n=2 Tax=Liquorilactobacillus hordei TaxID=468911 RepID=UPI001C629872|nr:IS3 family transposase [Liquorilactobacillus hordei]QYH52009.1 IS3 family transposase [Liquorilactobacillus hordei DSM 19519]
MQRDYPFITLLKVAGLARSTYYYHLACLNRPDKYRQVKQIIRQEFARSHQTYGYRRMRFVLKQHHVKLCLETVRKIMFSMGLKVTLFSKHSGRYNSYHGHVGQVVPNLLKQQFKAHKPYTVLHTDVSQFKLTCGKWGYISTVIDEASNEVLAAKVSSTPNRVLIDQTLETVIKKIPATTKPILHSDQGWQYQMTNYQAKLRHHHFIQSMSRKGNCLDNAPVESFFSMLKRECLRRIKVTSLSELSTLVEHYVAWYNNQRISLKRHGLTPVEYRKQYLTNN